MVLKGPVYPPTIHLPKVETKDQLDWFASKLNGLLLNNSNHQIGLIIFVESARSLLDMKELCQHCIDLQKQGAPFKLEGAVFGSDDFCADIGNQESKLIHQERCR